MSLQFTIAIKSGKVRTGISNIGEAIQRIRKRELKEAVTGARDEIIFYPPELPDQKYIRTGDYGNSWRIVSNDGLSYTLRSDGVDYAHWVGGYSDGTGQALIHAFRWTRLSDAMQRAARQFLVRVSEKIKQAIRNEGMGL